MRAREELDARVFCRHVLLGVVLLVRVAGSVVGVCEKRAEVIECVGDGGVRVHRVALRAQRAEPIVAERSGEEAGGWADTRAMGAWDEWDALLAQPEPDPLEVLRLAAQYERYLDAIMARAVPAARGAGNTWEQIGTAIGTSRQAVWQRYRTAWRRSVPATLQPSVGPLGLWDLPRLAPGDPNDPFGGTEAGK